MEASRYQRDFRCAHEGFRTGNRRLLIATMSFNAVLALRRGIATAGTAIRPHTDFLLGVGPMDILTEQCISMREPMQVSKWGNSLAIRLPAVVVEALKLREGDDVILHVAGRRTLEIEKTPSAKELLARLRKFRRRLPKDFKFDRLEANERR